MKSNKSLADKIYIRTRLIREASLEPLRVLDLFAGEGVVWGSLRRDLNVAHYTPVDREVKQDGQIRINITPTFIEALNLSKYNVIDVDMSGDPWAIWNAILPRIKTTTAVFLTRKKPSDTLPLSRAMKETMGIPVQWDVPGEVRIIEYGDRYQLLQQCPTAKATIIYGIRSDRVDYYALLLKPLDDYGNIVESTVGLLDRTRDINFEQGEVK